MGLQTLRPRLIASLVVALLGSLLLLDRQPLPPQAADAARVARSTP